MAKKIVKKTVNNKSSKIQKKELRDVKVEAKIIPEPQTKKVSGKVIAAIAAVIILLFAEMAYVAGRQVQLNRKPILVDTWTPQYKGLNGMVVYGKSLFCMDNDSNIIQRYDKYNGKLIGIYELEDGITTAAEDTNGNVILLSRTGVLYYYKDSKLKKSVKTIEGIEFPTTFVVDSENNFYFEEPKSLKIYKYSSDLQKLKVFGGLGGEKSKFLSGFKMYVSPNDEIYCLERGKGTVNVKIFSKDGIFINAFVIKNLKNISGLENLAISKNGDLYINDMNGSQILVYSRNGKNIAKFNLDLAGAFKITYPAAIAGGQDGVFIVSTHKVAVFQTFDNKQ